MVIKNSLLHRFSVVALANTMLAISSPAVAVEDPQTTAHFIEVERRIDEQDRRTQTFLSAQGDLIEKQRADFNDLSLQVEQQRQDISILKSEVELLKQDVADLKARQNTDPGKQAPPGQNRDPAKPADGESLSLRAPFTVKDASGRVIFKVDSVSGTMPRAVIGNPTGSRVEIGLGTEGAAVIGLYDASNKPLAALVGNPTGSYLRVKDDEQSASLGKVEGDGSGLFLRKDGKEYSEVSVGKTGLGIVRVFGADGKPVGGLFAGTDGGGLALTGTGGGKSAVSLSVAPSGGKVRVYPVGGGTARAELIADGATGALNIFDIDGATAANLASVESKAGLLEIANGNGQIVVRAGAQKDGRGKVTTGPIEGALAGSMGGGLEPAATIVGRLTGK